MKRTTIFLDEQVETELKALARRKRLPMAAVVRDALERHVARETVRAPLSFVGVGRSGSRDTAERHEEILAKRFSARMKRRRHAKR
jgi:predicted transcriptional regulator